MKNQMRAASVLHVQAGENRLSVEVTPDAVYFERETGKGIPPTDEGDAN